MTQCCESCFYWCDNNDTGEECYGTNDFETWEQNNCRDWIPNMRMPITMSREEE